MILNNPIFINQTDADVRYVNTTGDAINGTLSVTGLTVSGLGTSFILKSASNGNSVSFDPTINGNAGILATNYISTISLQSVGDQNLSLLYGGGGTRNITFKGGGVSVNRVILDSDGNFGIGSGISSVPSRFYVSGDSLLQGNLTTSGSGTFTSGLDLNNSNLINATPQIINLSANFNISGNYNSRMVMVNSANEVTGRIVSGNALGFNATIMQVGVGQVLITGSGIGIRIGSYNNQYKTAGQFATASVLHTGSNGYIMYGNTTL
jgi:hypothetical protein